MTTMLARARRARGNLGPFPLDSPRVEMASPAAQPSYDAAHAATLGLRFAKYELNKYAKKISNN